MRPTSWPALMTWLKVWWTIWEPALASPAGDSRGAPFFPFNTPWAVEPRSTDTGIISGDLDMCFSPRTGTYTCHGNCDEKIKELNTESSYYIILLCKSKFKRARLSLYMNSCKINPNPFYPELLSVLSWPTRRKYFTEKTAKYFLNYWAGQRPSCC